MNNLKNIKISIKAIVISALFDIIGTSLWSSGLMIYLISTHKIIAGPLMLEQVKELMNINTHPIIFIVSYSGGIIFSIAAGYISAVIAKRDELVHGTLSSFLCVFSGVYGIISGMSNSSFISQLLFLLLSPTLGLIGGCLRIISSPKSKQ